MTRKRRGKKRTNELGCLAFKERRRTKERSLRSSASTLAKKFILASGERKREGGGGGRSADRKSAAGWRKLKMVARKKGRKEGSGYIDDVRLRG